MPNKENYNPTDKLKELLTNEKTLHNQFKLNITDIKIRQLLYNTRRNISLIKWLLN